MIAIILALALVCALLAYLLIVGDKKNSKLVAENSQMKGRMEVMQENAAQQEPVEERPLTVDEIMEAVRFAGYVPEKHDTWVRFMVSGEPFLIDTERLPQFFVVRDFGVDTKEWEMDLLKHAAHLMSDDLIMIKAIFCEDAQSCELRFFVAAMDRNYASFRDNLTRYLGLIQEGQGRMNEIYQNLVKEKRDAALAINPVLPQVQTEKKIMS